MEKFLVEISARHMHLSKEAVDALFDNAKRGKKAAVERNRHLKSLSDLACCHICSD